MHRKYAKLGGVSAIKANEFDVYCFRLAITLQLKHKFILMKLRLCFIIMLVCMTLVSCLNDTDYNYTYTDDAAITAFSLGTLNRYVNTVSSKTGNDTTVKYSVTGSSYKFYIDQETCQIYNTDSLPYGTDLAHVLCSVTSYNSGAIGIKSLTSDSLLEFSSSDSIDFTEPRQFQVYSLSGVGTRIYQVSVNAHKEKADSFAWHQMSAGTEMASLIAMKGLSSGNGLFVMGTDGSEAQLFKSADGTSWQQIDLPSAISSTAYSQFCAIDGTLLVNNQGTLLYSDNGIAWSTMDGISVDRLLGTSSKSIFVVDTEGNLKKSSDFGSTWTEIEVDGDKAYLPTKDITMTTRKMEVNSTGEYVLLTGNCDAEGYLGDSTSVVWNYVEETDEYSQSQPISLMEWKATDKNPLPHIAGLQVARSGDNFFAMGPTTSSDADSEAFSAIYQSLDNGLTWQSDDNVTPPEGLSSASQAFTLFADSDNFLWVVSGENGNVWRGRINKFGWANEKKSVTE